MVMRRGANRCLGARAWLPEVSTVIKEALDWILYWPHPVRVCNMVNNTADIEIFPGPYWVGGGYYLGNGSQT